MKQIFLKTAFSLIELMVVIAILSILAAVAIPSYQKYMQRANLAEAVAVLGEYKTAIAVFWSTEGKFPGSGDTIKTSPVDLPFDTVVTTDLPNSISSLKLSSSGNGVLVTAVVSSGVFSTFSSTNRSLYLGAKRNTSGQGVIFQCGNFATDASGAGDLGFTDRTMLPTSCNYNGIGAWLAS